MQGQSQKLFSTNDLWLASYLDYRGIPPQLKSKNHRVIFVFPQSDTLYKLVTAFNMGDSVPLADYISTLKELKIKMFQVRSLQPEQENDNVRAVFNL